MLFIRSAADLATPAGLVLLALSLASGSAAAMYAWKYVPKEPTADDLRFMSRTESRVIARLSPVLYFLLGAVAPWIAWPALRRMKTGEPSLAEELGASMRRRHRA